jgi:cation diffusion facilitator CzcD-associated flavoprotein CzcO
MDSPAKVCIVGAGSSGITACQVLKSRQIPYDCFEKGSMVGGNWRYQNDNGVSSAYRSLHINSARKLMSYRAFPMPESYPDYPSHWQVAQYFDDYVERFGLAQTITFNTEVTAAVPVDDGWRVTVNGPEGERSETYRAVIVANGHHWNPRWPEPSFPGSEEFEGEQIHVHHYREPDILVGKRVLVLGIGNSSVDIAVESSRIAEKTFLSMRRGAHVLPKFLNGKPVDESVPPLATYLPIPVQRFFAERAMKIAVGEMTDYGLPKPDHKLFEAHPTVSSEVLPRIGHGDIEVRPNIERFAGGRTIRFVDGGEEEIDLVVYCTGYKITFPFLSEDVFSAADNRMPLYRRVADPDHPGLYFVGFVQPLGPIMPIAEAQAEWLADLLRGKSTLPSPAEMHEEIDEYGRWLEKRFVASKRHTIEVDFHPYLREIRRERKRVAQPA